MKRVILPEHPGAGGRLGRHVAHDPGSRAYPVDADHPGLHTQLWQRRTRPFDQGDLGECTIESAVGVLVTAPLSLPTHDVLRRASGRIVAYSYVTAHDTVPGQYPPQDTGSTCLDVAKWLRSTGRITSYRWAFTAGQREAALMAGALVSGTVWRTGMDEPDERGVIHATGDDRGGHAWETVGVFRDVDEWFVVGIQSWGPGWPARPALGHAGRFALPLGEWHELVEADGEVVQYAQ